MNRKTTISVIVVCAVIAIGLLLYFLFFNNKNNTPSIQPVNSSLSTSNSQNIATESTPIATTTSSKTNCSNVVSIEHDDCVLKKAVVARDSKVCNDIENSLTKNYCVSSVSSKTKYTEISLSPYAVTTNTGKVATNIQTSASTNNTAKISTIDFSSEIKDFLNTFSNDNSTTTSFAGFTDRMANKASLVLFIVNPVTAKVGERVTATGSGFLKSGNTITIGNQPVTDVGSADGMTLIFTVPQLSNGRYEVFVSNSRGSSQRSQFPIYMTISDNPAPLPVLTGVSPAHPTLSDTVTVLGDSLTNIAGVYTSLGVAPGVSFKISDLPFYHMLQTALPKIQAKTVPIIIMVMTDVGLSQPLSVDLTVK